MGISLQDLFTALVSKKIVASSAKLVTFQPGLGDDEFNDGDVLYFPKKDKKFLTSVLEGDKTFFIIYVFSPHTRWFGDYSRRIKEIVAVRGRMISGDHKQSCPYEHVIAHIGDNPNAPHISMTVLESADRGPLHSLSVHESQRRSCVKYFEQNNTNLPLTTKRARGETSSSQGVIKMNTGATGEQVVQTDPELYSLLDKVYNFNFDPCPLDPQWDGLTCQWGSCNYVNPPYKFIFPWVFKAIHEANTRGATSVFLIPASVSTHSFKYAMESGCVDHILFLNHFIRFASHEGKFSRPVMIMAIKPNISLLPPRVIFDTLSAEVLQKVNIAGRD